MPRALLSKRLWPGTALLGMLAVPLFSQVAYASIYSETLNYDPNAHTVLPTSSSENPYEQRRAIARSNPLEQKDEELLATLPPVPVDQLPQRHPLKIMIPNLKAVSESPQSAAAAMATPPATPVAAVAAAPLATPDAALNAALARNAAPAPVSAPVAAATPAADAPAAPATDLDPALAAALASAAPASAPPSAPAQAAPVHASPAPAAEADDAPPPGDNFIDRLIGEIFYDSTASRADTTPLAKPPMLAAMPQTVTSPGIVIRHEVLQPQTPPQQVAQAQDAAQMAAMGRAGGGAHTPLIPMPDASPPPVAGAPATPVTPPAVAPEAPPAPPPATEAVAPAPAAALVEPPAPPVSPAPSAPSAAQALPAPGAAMPAVVPSAMPPGASSVAPAPSAEAGGLVEPPAAPVAAAAVTPLLAPPAAQPPAPKANNSSAPPSVAPDVEPPRAAPPAPARAAKTQAPREADNNGEPERQLSPESEKMLKRIRHLGPPPEKPGQKIAIDHAKETPDVLKAEGTETVKQNSMGMSIEVKKPKLDMNYLLQEAYNALTAGHTEDAMGMYREVLANDPSNTNALFGLATLYHRAGQLDKARPLYDRLLAIDPNYRDGMNNFLVLLADEAPQEALAHLQQLEQRNPTFSPIPAQMAIIYEKMGQLDKANTQMVRAIDLAPENLVYRYNLAIMLDKQKKYDEAARLYRQLVEAYEHGDSIPGDIDKIQQRLTFISSNSP